MAAKEFFDGLETKADPAKLAGMTNSYLFDIEGEGQWFVNVQDGALSVAQGAGDGDADATISTSARRSRRSSRASRTRRRRT